MEKSMEEKRYIDANALIRKHCKTSIASVWGQFGEEHWYSDSVDVDDIKRFPTADVEEVVRCIDCEYKRVEDMCMVCALSKLTILCDSYCWRGKRK